jgi:DNA (cytosine-5)-methyltransferase 1
VVPRELARAQGFGDDYVLTGTAAQQVAKIGNSVSPPVAEAVVRENCVEAA